jgi:hypothetical protein
MNAALRLVPSARFMGPSAGSVSCKRAENKLKQTGKCRSRWYFARVNRRNAARGKELSCG